MPGELGWGMLEPSRRKARGCPVRWSGQQAVAALPRHVGRTNADRVSEDLLTAIGRGPAVLILDMTATLSCDHLVAEVLTRVCRRAVARGAELRLVIAAAAVRRVVALSGLDQLAPVFPALAAAEDESPTLAAVLPLPRRPVCPDAEPEAALTRIASSIFRAGLTLQDALDQPAGLRRAAEEVLDLLDCTAGDARTAAFARLPGGPSDSVGAGLAEVVRLPETDAKPGLFGTTSAGIVPRSRLLALEAAQHRARASEARARALELASRAAATHDRIAASLSLAALSLPLHARRLRVGSESVASRAVRMRQWAEGETATG